MRRHLILAGIAVLASVVALDIRARLARIAGRGDAVPAVPQVPDAEATAGMEAARAKVLAAPLDPEAWGEYGRTLWAYDADAEADVCLERAARLAPRSAEWPYLLAVRRLEDDPPGALPLLRKAAELEHPSGAVRLSIRLRLAETLLAAEKPEEAEPIFRAEAEANPGDARARHGLALVALARGEWGAAEDQLRPLAAHPSLRRKVARQRAALAQRRGDAPSAAALHAESAAGPEDESWPDPLVLNAMLRERGAQSFLMTAERLKADGRLADATPLIRQALELNPRAQTRVVLATNLVARNLLDEARAELDAAIAAEPGLAQARVMRATIHVRRAREGPGDPAPHWAAAEADASAVIAQKPDSAVGLFYRGLARRGLGRLPDAVADLRAAADLRPRSAEIHVELARTLAQAGDRAAAEASLKLAESVADKEDPRPAELRREWAR